MVRNENRFSHGVLVVDADDTIERLLVPLLRRKIAADQAVLMVVSPSTAQIVHDRLAGEAHALQWAATETFYQRLGFTYSRFDGYLRKQHALRRRIHVIAEPDLVSDVRAPVSRAAAYLGYEAMVNDVFAGYGSPITCIWHGRHHPPRFIDEVRKVHQEELTARGRQHIVEYLPPHDYLDTRAETAMTPVPPVTDIDVTVSQLDEVALCRDAVARWAAGHGFVAAAVRQVVIAGSEVVTNGLLHGRSPVRVRAWSRDGTLIVHVEDHGGQRIPAAAGYRPPRSPADPAGMWIARQLADVVLTRTDSGQTAVRLYFPYALTHRYLDVP